MSSQAVRSKGIYHGLPVYSLELTGLTAIITGANGISGHAMLDVLAESPQRWSKIYCLSRRPPYVPGGLPANAVHVAVDFLTDPEDIAKVLTQHGVNADHIFFFAYIQTEPKSGKGLWSDAEEMVRVNSLLLDNFLAAIKIANIKPKRFMLQTGAKNYGVHHGPTKVPQEETDPRVKVPGEPNFYHPQEDSLWRYCQESGGTTGWSILMPGPILGAVPDAAMNLAFPLAVYATVTKALHEKLRWPGTSLAFRVSCSMSSAKMNAYMEEWAVLTEVANDQKFNTFDGGAFAWEGFWPRLAGWYGLEWEGLVLEAQRTSAEQADHHREKANYSGSRLPSSLVEWAKQEKVQKAWVRLAAEHDLVQKHGLTDIDRIFGFADGSMTRAGALMYSSDKARKLGWHGFVDTSESLLAVFDDLARMKMIPPVPKIKVQFL